MLYKATKNNFYYSSQSWVIRKQAFNDKAYGWHMELEVPQEPQSNIVKFGTSFDKGLSNMNNSSS